MQKTILFLLLSLALGPAMAGTWSATAGPKVTDQIVGAVRQSGSNRPLRDVTVTVYEDQQVRLKAIVTDEDGSFGLGALKPGTYKLVFQKEGYRKVVREKVVVKTEGGIRLDVEMEESPYELSPSPFHFFRTDE